MKYVDDESKKGEQETKIKNTGKKDPKRHLGLKVEELLDENLNAILGRMMATKAFWMKYIRLIKMINNLVFTPEQFAANY